MRDVREFVRQRIRGLRLQRGLTQVALSERAGISVDALTRIEGGTRTPSLETLDRIASALGMSIGSLVSSARPPPARYDAAVERIAALVQDQSASVQAAMEVVVRAVLQVRRPRRR